MHSTEIISIDFGSYTTLVIVSVADEQFSDYNSSYFWVFASQQLQIACLVV